MNRSELLALVTESRAKLDAALAEIANIPSTETSLYGAWSVKDMLAHIGWWEQRAADIITTLCKGDVPGEAIEFGDVNVVNARVYAENHDKSLVDVRASEMASYAALIHLIETTPELDLFGEHRFAWAGNHQLYKWVTWNTYEHFDEHVVELKAWIAKNRA